ncbi:MAG: prohibitin family protein [Clostridia bacterium]|nr:prohibitin family protein [Clostridia bacterium]
MNTVAKAVIALIIAVSLVGGIFCVASMERIGAGMVGVVYSMKDGVQDKVLQQGVHFINPFLKVDEFPVSQQQLVLSNNPADYNKSSHDDWHVDAPADGGMVKLNLTINYNFMQDKVTGLYDRFRGMDGETLVENMVQNSIIAYIKEVTPKFTVMEIYSTKRAEVGQAITEYLNTKLNDEYGINVSSALIIDVQLDETLMQKIQAKEQAKQDAEKAELDKQTAIAQAETDKVKAQAKADVALIAAKAEAEANKLKSDSITDELIKMKEAEARLKHGWVEVQGADSVVTTD